ncbi:hypothetical protein QWI17_12460 [Gilvimarinus sp. SDUM040013]|uniref:DUF4282 domain-containing protein n=1 Tax=Gilvimarinus gilvus TaxID=3058038 RepID=A0ABU4RX45_9GAMM|nr:hypothetical protein [Gilvimarinus sp. SDUM040013]MDO3386651.1 hypothetical protein [Gilvimarinus sp. SDUM040013]MDX6849462.1 hypothetical protein [Gilvimarinus sp. SDUM040013]
MRLKVYKVPPLKAAIIGAIVTFIYAVILLALAALAFMFGLSSQFSVSFPWLAISGTMLGVWIVFIPLVEAVIFFLKVLLLCWLFNIVVKFVGPLVFEYKAVRDKTHAEKPQGHDQRPVRAADQASFRQKI